MKLELLSWCVTHDGWGRTNYSCTHHFREYKTLILRKDAYYCECGLKISPQERDMYIEFLNKRREYQRKWREEI